MAKRIFEIINPHDKCFMEGDGPRAIAAATLLLGHGKYALTEQGGAGWTMPLFLMGGAEAWFHREFGETLDAYLQGGHEAALAEALESFRYAEERSSLSDIGEQAAVYARWLRRRAGEVATVRRLVVESPDAEGVARGA